MGLESKTMWGPLSVKLGLAVGLLFLLSACVEGQRNFGFGPQDAWVEYGWRAPQPQTPLSVKQCYRTLADVDCSYEVIPEARGRIVGHFDSPATPSE